MNTTLKPSCRLAKLPQIPVYAPAVGGGCTCGDPNCSSPGKHPILPWSEASNDPAVIEKWLKKYPGCNWGVILRLDHGVVAIDIDPRNGGLETIQQKGWKFPKTVTVNTGGGGIHYYYCDPYGIPGNLQLGPGVELKVNGMLVVPPSRHKSGGSYEWSADGLHPSKPFAKLPKWVFKEFQRAGKTQPKQEFHNNDRPAIDHAEPIPQGTRNTTLTSIAGKLRRMGYEREEIEAELLRINEEWCRPPLPVKEVQAIAKSIAKYPPGDVTAPRPGGAEPAEGAQVRVAVDVNQKDYGHARVLSELFRDKYRWAVHRGCWMRWVGTHWKKESEEAVVRAAAETLQRHYSKLLAEASSRTEIRELADKIKETTVYSKMTGALNFLKGWPGIKTEKKEWDANPWLLNVLNGTLDFREGTFREHNPRDLITKLAPVKYDPYATAPRWMQHIERFLPNPNVRRQVQRDLGRALVGAVLEERLSIWYGIGANGKTTTAKVLQKILGDYACQAAPNLLVQTKYEQHPTAIVDLDGRRLVFSTEIDQGKRLAEALVKQLTGGDKLKGRYMRQDFYEFDPTHSIILICNHKPIITGNDEGIWRRILLIAWEYTIPAAERRPQDEVIEELLEEAPGILNWLIAGLADWQNDRYWIAEEVRAASEAYRAAMDVIGKFIEDRCELGPRYTAPKGALYDAYTAWCMESGEQPMSKKAFTARLLERGIGEARDKNTRYYVGIRLNQ